MKRIFGPKHRNVPRSHVAKQTPFATKQPRKSCVETFSDAKWPVPCDNSLAACHINHSLVPAKRCKTKPPQQTFVGKSNTTCPQFAHVKLAPNLQRARRSCWVVFLHDSKRCSCSSASLSCCGVRPSAAAAANPQRKPRRKPKENPERLIQS